MPLYEYECDACGKRFEVIRKFSDPPLEVCTACGKGPIRRLQSSPAIQFKGSGWYITDYAQKGKAEKAGADGGGAGKPDAAAETDSAGKADAAAKSDTAASSTAASSTTTSSAGGKE